MKNTRIFLFAFILMTACAKKNNSPEPPQVIPDPVKTTLTAPAQNSLCNTGNIISATQASIVLIWTVAANSDSYEINIKNLLTGVATTETAGTNQLTITLSRSTPYSWYVVSKSKSTNNTAASDTWKFYVAGTGNITYSPFPAALTSPSYGQFFASNTAAVDLTWAGNDVDNDISSYDVYLGTIDSPPLFKNDIKDMFLKNINVAAKTVYYWKIISKDSKGNTSDSGVYHFSVN